MLPLISFAAGFWFGWVRAAKRGGQRLDKLQYGAGYGIAWFLLVFFLTLVADRIGLV